MSEPMTPAQEAAALWGSAENERHNIQERLQFALQALAFFGHKYDQERAEGWDEGYQACLRQWDHPANADRMPERNPYR